MIYRVLSATAGHPLDQNYTVAAYRALDFESYVGGVEKANGSLFAATLEEAREMIPGDARRLAFKREHQFLELWESKTQPARLRELERH